MKFFDKLMVTFPQLKSPAFWVGALGTLKLFLDALGYHILNDAQLNATANGIASLLAMMGVYSLHQPMIPAPAVQPVPVLAKPIIEQPATGAEG